MFDSTALALLFARHASSVPCQCHGTGYCPAHGTYEPPTKDEDVLAAVAEASRRTGSGLRVIRKRLPN